MSHFTMNRQNVNKGKVQSQVSERVRAATMPMFGGFPFEVVLSMVEGVV